MFKDRQGAIELAIALRQSLADVKDVDIAVCPPAVFLSDVAQVLRGSNIGVGAQNVHWADEGPFTGELSPGMILTTGAQYAIIGHSERRQYFGETDEWVNRRLRKALERGLKPIVCVGESLSERDSGKTTEVVGRQTRKALDGVTSTEILNVTLAYEPVWAIGTGRTATPEQAREVHKFIRGLVAEIYGPDTAAALRILYGGSVKADNIKALMAEPELDGALVGGASLKADEFTRIVKYQS